MLESPYYVDIFEGTNKPLEVAQASLLSIIDVSSTVQLKKTNSHWDSISRLCKLYYTPHGTLKESIKKKNR